VSQQAADIFVMFRHDENASRHDEGEHAGSMIGFENPRQEREQCHGED
jgi:hypothetical protein